VIGKIQDAEHTLRLSSGQGTQYAGEDQKLAAQNQQLAFDSFLNLEY
jgi:hypothetical protein